MHLLALLRQLEAGCDVFSLLRVSRKFVKIRKLPGRVIINLLIRTDREWDFSGNFHSLEENTHGCGNIEPHSLKQLFQTLLLLRINPDMYAFSSHMLV